MKKSLVLALALVFGVASASMAATPSFSGNVSLTVTSEPEFFGPVKFEPSVEVNTEFAESGEGWSLDAVIKTEWSGSAATVSLDGYKGVLELGSVTATVARNFGLGHIDTPFKWIRQTSNPGSGANDQLRLVASVSGVDIHTQWVGDTANVMKVRVQTDVDNFTLGAAGEVALTSSGTSNYAVYGTTKFGIAEFKAIYGSFDDQGEYAVDIGVQVTEQLNIGATYASINKPDTSEGYAVRANFTEGLLYANATYAEEDGETELWLKYRGSSDNQAFGDLFEGEPWEDKDVWAQTWDQNVAPAFAVRYTDKEGDDSQISLFAVAPLTSNAVGRAQVDTKAGDTGFLVEARFKLNEKTTFNPFVSQAMGSTDTAIGARLLYQVDSNAKITAEASQVGSNQKLTATYSIDF